ncbi:hypothetical protein PIIN_04642 [Serendipita indica DSM 11827]|uniref:Uncharacterized protein n=1 Tax=Serendipita indica (strain DSM 11827) TaxID=1109443 RepID=G4THB5_SERID|nr:hypothetical protein PIIN_04642 [Serendipita indica DSM 11827]
MEGVSSLPNGISDVDLADSIARRLATILFSSTFADKITWKDVPRALAERCLYLSGVPLKCAPVVVDNVVQDNYHSWSKEQLYAMHSALERNMLKIKVRNPVSRNVIFELVDEDGSLKDSTLGFSALWRHDYLFPERVYGGLNMNTLKSLNYTGLLKVLSAVEVLKIHEQLPWVSLPAKLYKNAYYLTGLPRVCTPRAVNDVFPDNVGSPSFRFRRDQRVALQRALDSGLLRLLERNPTDRDVIFEVLEPNGTFTDDDCGFSAEWKAATTLNIRVKHTGKSNAASSLAAIAAPTSSEAPKAPNTLLESILSSFVAILLPHGLLLDTVAGPAWIRLPQMLATKRLVIHGIPRTCIPIVKNDVVADNYDPLQWSLNSQVDFFNAVKHNSIKVIPRSRSQRILYNVLEENGTITSDTLGFSEQWCKDHLDGIDLADPNLSPTMYVIEMWLQLLERAKIPCHDNLGRRHIPWAYLPTLLARGKLCIIGCPKDCIPKVEKDIVVETSSPYFYDGLQLGLMYRAFKESEVSIGIRPPGKEALFACRIGDSGYVWESTLGFSDKWIEMNIRNPNPPFYMPHIMTMVSSMTAPQNYSFGPVVVAPATQVQVMDKLSVQTTVTGKLSAQSSPLVVVNGSSHLESSSANPESSSTGSLPQKRHNQDGQQSLKIRIPKRRATTATARPFTTEPLVHIKNTSASPPPSTKASLPVFAPLVKQEFGPVLSTNGLPPSNLPSTSGNPVQTPASRNVQPSHLTTTRLVPAPPLRRTRMGTRESIALSKQTREPSPAPSTSSSSSDVDQPGKFGVRESMSPPLPPRSLLPSPLPPVPVPECLPRPGGDLRWDDEKSFWELTISESWPPSQWKKLLPVFPARLIWDPANNLWMCIPSEVLTSPPPKDATGMGRIGLSLDVQAELDSARRVGPLPRITEGHSIIWHRWRRTWALFEYVARVPT